MNHTPNWLSQFVGRIAESVVAIDDATEIACHYFQSDIDSEWEVTLFPDSTQFGGRLSQYQLSETFSIDVIGVLQVFDEIANCRWQTRTISIDDEVGPHLSVEGQVNGLDVWLRIASSAPDQLMGVTPCERNTQRVE